MSKSTFDHLIGEQNDKTSEQDKKETRNLLESYINDLPSKDILENQRVGIRLEMENYIRDKSDQLTPAGIFLLRLLNLYKIKKSSFAEYIGVENANLHALLRGRRKFNSKIATLVGESFHIQPETWLYIEAKNELNLFQRKKERYTKSIDALKLSHNR